MLNELTLHSQAKKRTRCFALISCASPVLSIDIVIRLVFENPARGFVDLVEMMVMPIRSHRTNSAHPVQGVSDEQPQAFCRMAFWMTSL